MTATRLRMDAASLEDFCRRWKVTQLSLFGSALGDGFRDDSDIDLLVSFAPDADWSLLDHARMEDELASLLGREVDLVTRPAIERSRYRARRDAILRSARPVYVSG